MIEDTAPQDCDFSEYENLKSGFKTQSSNLITATPFVLRNERDIPPREWLYGHHLIRGFVSLTIAPGGVGKTALLVMDSIAMASGQELVK
jgi:RecA-family ATPase